MEVAAWLRGQGLEQYEPTFRENEIDATLLLSLTPDDLKDLGITLIGHRRRLLDAIAALGAPVRAYPPIDTLRVPFASREALAAFTEEKCPRSNGDRSREMRHSSHQIPGLRRGL